ncbi:MAG: hypothetical protein ACOY32_10850 [Thermodesulfobacteriota bacterium]
MTDAAKDKKDVLGNLLQGSHPDSDIPGLDELSAMIERYSRPLIAKSDVPPSPPPSRPVKESGGKRRGGKRKTTHYLTKEVFVELNQANDFLKGLLPAGSKLMATKSKIVNYAIKTLLEDFEAKGEDSELVKRILKEDTKKS